MFVSQGVSKAWSAKNPARAIPFEGDLSLPHLLEVESDRGNCTRRHLIRVSYGETDAVGHGVLIGKTITLIGLSA